MPNSIVYLNGRFIPRSEACISPDDRGFYFGDGVYEVVRFYNGRPFEMDAHLARLGRSLAGARIEGIDVPSMADVITRLVTENDLTDAIAYLQITRGEAPRDHPFPTPAPTPTVYGFAKPCSMPQEVWEHGVPTITVPDKRWGHCNIKSLNLLANVLANQAAKEAGVEEAILVNDGMVTEGSHTNVAAVIDGTVVTHPEEPCILSGISRGVTLALCLELGIPVEERPLSLDELYAASEVMIMSTSDEVMPVVKVDDKQIGDGQPGPIARRLLDSFRARVREGASPQPPVARR